MANAGVVKVLSRKFGVGQWSFIGSGSEKKWYSAENSPQGAWDNIEEQMLLEFAVSGHPIVRATTPLSRGILESKGCGKLSIHFAADEGKPTEWVTCMGGAGRCLFVCCLVVILCLSAFWSKIFATCTHSRFISCVCDRVLHT